MRLPFGLLLCLLIVPPVPVLAQEMTDEELLDLFTRQRDAFQSARQGGLGMARGLELVTVDDLSTSPDLATSETVQDDVAPAVQDQLMQPADPDASDQQLAGRGSDRSRHPATAGAEGLAQPAGSDALGTTVTAAANPSMATPGTVVFGQLDESLQVNVRVTFAFDSAVLAEDQLPKLDQLCHVMKDSGINLFRIVGHTDAAGSAEYNEKLSLLRAEEVRRYFIGQCGMTADRLEAVGLGERFLFEPSDPRAGANRRVEFQALS
ncbi:OmpA family protein [Rubellimicrobium arenae]|uniref:OmpA family protein n=1 Tax=Rubellimicrobium arenae TaxID=2817372 RepID=UPI001B310C01|nr:OmpA family protein [Rubellimicrobium arenae]